MCRRQFKLYKKAVRGIIALEQGKARGGMRLAQEEQNQEAWSSRMPWRAQRADFLIFAKFRKEIGSQQSIRECFATIQNIFAFFAPSRPAAGAAIYDL